jgi:hypothetical protein
MLRGRTALSSMSWLDSISKADELDHDFLWRVVKRLPPPGDIGIFNRSPPDAARHITRRCSRAWNGNRPEHRVPNGRPCSIDE